MATPTSACPTTGSTAAAAAGAARRVIEAIPILADTAASGGCGHCHSVDAEPVCAVPMRPGMRPSLSGSQAELVRVEQALVLCPELGGFGLSSGVIRSIHAEGGDVELLLNVGACGGGARLVHAVFDHLRQLLPDTDIYVRPAG
ncbi:MAG: hypothetical protein RLZZ584_876 [Pseudomonadota bacterium]